MAKFYSDEDFPMPVSVALRALGHDVATIQQRGMANESTPDLEVLTSATSEGRVVLTLNRKDFYRLHEQNPTHAGIIVCVADNDFERLAQRIHDRIQVEGDLTGRLIRVPPRE
jgi:predicted nuclease of predicted toxin-antitoxin system